MGTHRRQVISMVAVVAILAVLLVLGYLMQQCPTVHTVNHAKKRDCPNNLKQIGLYLILYVEKYGGGTAYPPTNDPTCNFLDYLRNMPTTTEAIAANRHGLFVCKICGTLPGPKALDYRYPAPSRVIDSTCHPDWPIACDRLTNHDRSGPDDITVLLFDGSVHSVSPSHHLWTSCVGSASSAWMAGP